MDVSRPLYIVCVLATLTLLVSSTTTSATETSLAATPDATCFSPVINNQVFTNKESPVPGSRAGPRDCAEVQSAGHTQSGRYTVYPDDGGDPFSVYCDMDTSGGGWTVFQRRENGFVDFYRTWSEYETGFGILVGEHWLGNEKIHRLTSQKRYELRIDLQDWEGNDFFAVYDLFIVMGAETDYQLVVGDYSGDAGDGLTGRENGERFSTRDADHDSRPPEHCAQSYGGGWWYADCYYANLNGRYHIGGQYTPSPKADGIVWYHIRNSWTYSLKTVEMKMRPK